VRRTKWFAVAVAVAVAVLGAVGCGADEPGTGEAATSASPRPEGTGPLTKAVVRADLDGSAAGANVPADEEFARGHEDARAGTPRSCSVALKAWATDPGTDTDTATIDIARYEAVVRELRERAWRVQDRRVRKTPDGGTGYARMIFKQRGWTLFAEFMPLGENGVITLMASEDACMKKVGASVDQVA
jgi:hypothetical protein